MKKNLVGFVLMLVMLTSFALVNVSAAGQIWLEVDFEDDANVMVNEGSDPAGVSRAVEDEGGNKAFRFNNTSATTLVSKASGKSVSASEIFVQFDFKMNNSTDPASKYLYVDLHAGNKAGTRYSLVLRENNVESGGAFSDGQYAKPFPNTKGVWFTYLVCWKNFGTTNAYAEVYRKEKNSSADYTYIGKSKPATSAGWGNAAFRIYGNGVDCSVDNITMWSGTVFGGGSFSMEGEAVSELNQITDGALEGKATVVSNGSGALEATPIMVFFDAHGRMVGCEFGEHSGISVGRNDITLSTDTTEYNGKLEGGLVEFYVWEDIELARPMFDAIVLD